MANQASSLPGRFRNWLYAFADGYAPEQRMVYSAYAELETLEGKDVGTFVLGLYQMAKKPGGLRVQKFQQAFIDAKKADDASYEFSPNDLKREDDGILCQVLQQFYPEKDGKNLKHTLERLHGQLYRDDHSPKTAFELALLPTNCREEIQKIMRREYSWQQDHGLLPQEIYRAQMGDWLGHLDQTNYRIKEKGVREMNVTLDNAKPKPLENIIHYSMDWVAFVATMSSVILAVTAVTGTPLLGFAAGLANYIAFEKANLFDTFGYGEWFWKDARWLSTRNFADPKNIDLKKLAQTAFFTACIGFVAYSGAASLYAATLGFPGLSSLGALGAQAVAGTVAAWSFATTVIGLSIPLRFLRGMSIHSNQVDPSAIPADLPELELDREKTRTHLKLKSLREALATRGEHVDYYDVVNPRNLVLSAPRPANDGEDDVPLAPAQRSGVRKRK